MSFGGSAAGANVVMKNNKRTRQNKLKRYEEHTGANYTSKKLTYKKINKEDLNSFSESFKRKQQATQKRQLVVFTLAAIAIIAIAIYFLYFYDAGCLICYSDR